MAPKVPNSKAPFPGVIPPEDCNVGWQGSLTQRALTWLNLKSRLNGALPRKQCYSRI